MAKINFADKAYKTIKNHIITYQLKPGTTLTFDKLSSSLNMSQTPIREALSRLWQEHFVERENAKGYVVSSLNATQVKELYDLRIILEVPGIRQAIRLIGNKGLSELKALLQRVKTLIDAQQRGDVIELDRQFHAIILKHSGNTILREMGENILDRVYRVQNLNILTSDRLFTAHKHHEEIFKALWKKDEKEAVDLMEKHLVSAKEYILSRLQDEDDILIKLLS